MKIQLFTTSAVLAILLFSGCGGGVSDNSITKQPHDTSKLGRTVAQEKDWTWDVSFSADIAGRASSLQAHFWEGVPDDIENFQTFIDMDSDASTGYSGSDGWEIYGADYLIENGDVYKSMSTSEWKWKLIGSFQDIDYKRLKGQGGHEILDMSNVTPTLSNIFTTNNFKVMIEAYDANWKGDCSTITGVVAEVEGFDGDTGENKKPILKERRIDLKEDGTIDKIVRFDYDDFGNTQNEIVEDTNSSKKTTTHYCNEYVNGALHRVTKTGAKGEIITTYDAHKNPIIINTNGKIKNISYQYTNDYKILTKVEKDSNKTEEFVYDYDNSGNLIKIANKSLTQVQKFTYNTLGKKLTHEITKGSSFYVLKNFNYSEKGLVSNIIVDKLIKGKTTHAKVYTIYEISK
jgi:YD repeat-containing protein